ncbi:MAG: hypothetical protein K2X44_08650, partial [Magnetospirillum sp.]|nr:hypothetical protein [Magnetospirillum sp.]
MWRKWPLTPIFGLAAILATLWNASTLAADPPKRQVEDVRLEVIETGYEPMSCCSMGPSVTVVGNWLSDDAFAFNALRDVSDANPKQLQRAVIYTIKTKRSMVIVPEGVIQCWNAEQEIASIKRHVSEEHGRLMRLDSGGNLSELTEPSNLDDFFCWPRDLEERLSGIPGFKSGGLHF